VTSRPMFLQRYLTKNPDYTHNPTAAGVLSVIDSITMSAPMPE
jgi:hypothetical protein